MPNFMITTACNLRCDYCFAMDLMASNPAVKNMSLETFKSIMDWVDKSNAQLKTIQLMGGEPTLSPLLLDMMNELEARNHKVIIFSNLTVPLSQAIINTTKANGVEWVVNANDPITYSREQADAVRQNLSALSARASLCYNVYATDMGFDHIFEYISKYQLKPLIKLGIALPTFAKKNAYIHPGQFEQVKIILNKLHARARENNVRIATECGAPYCLFKEILEQPGDIIFEDPISHCGSRLDIAPDGTLINCLPLSRAAAKKYTEFEHYGVASKWFHDFVTPYRSLSGIMDECFGCEFLLRGDCKVCLANSLDQYNRLAYPPLPSADS